MQVQLPRDAEGYVRRECGRCHREFKTLASRRDAAMVQKVLLSALPHANYEEVGVPPPVARCPYCGHRAQAEDWLYEVHRRALEELGVSLGQHVRFAQMQQVQNTFVAKPTYVLVSPPALELELPPEEEGGFVPLHFFCCGEDALVLPGEVERHFCPRCGKETGPAPKVGSAQALS